jgi:hypothetical protein
MQNEGTPTEGLSEIAKEEHRAERSVLTVLSDAPGLWSLDEIGREVFQPELVEDAVNRLRAFGLVHRIEDFAFASRAALHAQRYEP